MNQRLSTRFTELFGVEHPITQGGPEQRQRAGRRGRAGRGDLEHGTWRASMAQGLIHDVPTVDELVGRIVADACELTASHLGDLIQTRLEPTGPLAEKVGR